MANEEKESLVRELFGTVKDRVVNFPSDLVREVGQEVVHQVGAGSHELAAALFAGQASGFVMYPRQERKDDHGVHGPEPGQDHGVHGPPQEHGPGGPEPEQQQQRGRRM